MVELKEWKTVARSGLTEEFLDLITGELETGYQLSDDRLSDLPVYITDLSALRLRLSPVTPVISVTARDLDLFGQSQIAEWVREELVVRQDAPASAIVLVERDGSFLDHLGRDPYWAAIVDKTAIRRIVHDAQPRRALLESLLSQIPLRFLSPYEPSQPVTGSQFYGRSSELNLVRSHLKRSFAIEGGRRIGKTSLLKEIKRVLLDAVIPEEQAKRVVWYDFWGYEGDAPFFEEIVRHFGEGFPKLVRPDFASYFPRFIMRMKGTHGGHIIFVFDEMDDLIKHEQSKSHYRLLNLLKRIAQAGDCSLVMAGFRDLSEELSRHDTPLNFCQRVPLHNLNREQTMAMLREPMRSMGVRIQREVLPQILSDTGGHPQLVQHYGHALIEILDKTSEREVTMAHVQQVKRTGSLYDSLVDMLIDNTRDLEFALACGLAGKEKFGLAEMDALLRSHGIQLSLKEINDVCRKLEAIGVISRKGRADTYQFSIPLQPALACKLVGGEYLWTKALEQVQQEGLGYAGST